MTERHDANLKIPKKGGLLSSAISIQKSESVLDVKKKALITLRMVSSRI